MDTLVAEEQAALLTQLTTLYTWFGPLAKGVRNAKRDLGNASTIIPQEWPLMLPHEREAAVQALLGEYCSARGTGTLNGAAVMYRALFQRIGFAWEHCRSNGSAADAIVTILQRVRSLEAVYRQASLGVSNVARMQAFASWEQTLFSPAGIITVKVQRLNGPVLKTLLANLDHLLRKLQEMPPDDLPMPDIFLPSADTLFILAHLAAGSTDDRFRRLRDLFNGIVALVFAPSSTVPDLQRRSVLSARGSLAQPHSAQHFAALSPARQFFAVNSACKLLFSACERMELDRKLPNVDQLPTHEDSLAHPQRNISDRKARRYYGTTSRAWTAHRAGMGW
ncbi:hypothetical protein JCM10450v2_006611 [Rhodotorula kratochvilovae]